MSGTVAALLEFGPKLLSLADRVFSATDETKRMAQLLEFQKALVGLNSLVASVQQENATLLQQKNDAEAKLKRMEDWETEKEGYMLAQPYPGCFVYAVHKEISSGEDPHYLCAACFDNGKRSVLQGRENRRPNGMFGNSSYICPNPACKSEVFTKQTNVPPPVYWEDTLGD